MDNEQYNVIFENPDSDTKNIIENIKPMITHRYDIVSTAGIETITLVISFAELIIAIISYPMLLDCINKNEVKVKIQGYNINDFPKKIIKQLKNNPALFEKIKEAYINNEMEIDGCAKSINEFILKLEELINEKKG